MTYGRGCPVRRVVVPYVVARFRTRCGAIAGPTARVATEAMQFRPRAAAVAPVLRGTPDLVVVDAVRSGRDTATQHGERRLRVEHGGAGYRDGVDRWGTFISPDPDLADRDDLHERLGLSILSGHRANLREFAHGNPVFGGIADAVESAPIAYEDQCSAKHYFDVFSCLEEFCREHRVADRPRRRAIARLLRGRRKSSERTARLRVLDVGCFMGGSASIFAGCIGPYGLEVDLVDIMPKHLQFAYERLRRTYPDDIANVRMFYGDLPTYVQQVLLQEEGVTTFVHHDGAHEFTQVVKDLAALSFARDRVDALAIQDTHLRLNNFQYPCFVDAAVFAVFGRDVVHRPLGVVHGPDSPLVEPDQYVGNYCLVGEPEGMYIKLSDNSFRFPHRTMGLESLLPAEIDQHA